MIGAQRDSLSWGYAKSTVGTTLLMELARAFTELKKGMFFSTCVQMQSLSVDCGMCSLLVLFTLDGFKPKRSIVFASWTAGDFGNVGVTEWLEVCVPISSVLGNNCKQFVLKLSYGFVTCCFFCVKQGYWASLDRKAFTYISLDGVVTGKFTECKWSKFIIGFCTTNYNFYIYIWFVTIS